MELSCPAPKHCEYGRKMASAASEAHETPRLSATFSSHDPLKTARLNQAGRKNKLRHSCGVTATLATKNHKALYSLLRDQEVACSETPLQKLQTLVARSRWPGPGGPVPWPSPGGPVPVARSRWPGPGPALRARARGPARKKTYSVLSQAGSKVSGSTSSRPTTSLSCSARNSPDSSSFSFFSIYSLEGIYLSSNSPKAFENACLIAM